MSPETKGDGNCWYIIFSIDDVSQTDKFKNHCFSRAIPLKELKGCYKGKEEQAFIMPMFHFDGYQDTIGDFVKDQETVLEIAYLQANGDRAAFLRDTKTLHYKSLGNFHVVPKQEALKHQSWTFDPYLGEYFITEHE